MSGFDRNRIQELPREYAAAVRYFEHFKSDTGKGSSAVDTYLNRVTDFFEWLASEADEPSLNDLEKSHAVRYTNRTEAEFSASTYRHRIITINNLFEVTDGLDARIWMRPVEGLPDSQEVRDPQKHGRGLDVSDMSRFIRSVRNPLWHAFFLTLVKTMCRNQEATNIRLSEVHIDDPDVKQLYDDLDITLDSSISHHPDTLYIPSDRVGNKRRTSTRIPIDSELKAALIRWLAVRPTTEDSLTEPQTLFVSQGDNWGQPLSSSSTSQKFDQVAFDSWRPDDNPFSPHDFRHWTNRKIRTRIPDALLSYLRGDAPDMLDHYDDLLAEYDDRVRDPYLTNIPSLYYK